EAGAAATPLNVTRLDAWLAPKFVPKMETDVPIGPVVGPRPLMTGGKTGEGVVMRESYSPLSVPSIRSSAFTAVLPGAALTNVATRRKNRSVDATVTLAAVAHVSATAVNVVVRAAVPVVSQ